MNTSARLESLWESEHAQQRRGNPGADAAPPEPCADEQTSSGNSPRPYVPDGSAAETFDCGAGI
jgi:hypothetical protein